MYVYQFRWGSLNEAGESPLPGRWGFLLGACHTLEIPFFLGTETLNGPLGTLLFVGRNRAGRLALSAAMMDYAAEFARTGNPNRPGNGLPEWVPWTNKKDSPKCILFDGDNEKAIIRMSPLDLTQDEVYRRVASRVSESLFAEAVEYVESRPVLHTD